MIERGELDNRFDAGFYKENLDTNNFIKLSSLAYIKGGKRIPKEMNYSDVETNFLYLRVDDIGEFGNLKLDSLKYLQQDVFDALQRYELRPNEVVVSIAGTIGKITLLKKVNNKRIILTENAAKLVLKTRDIIPEYLKLLLELPIVQKQMQLSYIQTTIPKLALERIANLKVPAIPPLHIQKQIIQKYETAYQSKQQKEQQAAQLLATIDNYLMQQLGIVLPTTTNSEKTFFISSDKVSGGRFDPFYYTSEFELLEKGIEKSTYPIYKLKAILKNVKKGIEVGSEQYTDKGIPFIRVADISDKGVDYANANKKISPLLYDNLKEVFSPKEGEILYSKDGTIGFCCYLSEVEPCILSGGILRLTVSIEFVNPIFLTYLLSCRCFKQLANRVSIGTVIKHLTLPEWLNLPIPLPPLAIQNKIAAHISALRTEAQRLESEAVAGIEAAKKEIEAMILGKGGNE